MKVIDVLKVLIMLFFAVSVVALFCYLRVDMFMSWNQIITKVEDWNSNFIVYGLIVWSVAITLILANRRGD